ncbi:MAG: hypothetical protein ACRCZ0_11530 [Cetobacterium sp.]
MARIRNVERKGEYTVPVLTVETAVPMGLGVLYGLNEEGYAIVADATKSIHAVGIVDKTSTRAFGAEFSFSNPEVLNEGEYIDVYTHAIVYADEIAKAEGVVVGDTVYLGEEGMFTIVKPTAGIAQVVGAVANAKKGIVRLAIMGKGE